jgi:hypothetical protein
VPQVLLRHPLVLLQEQAPLELQVPTQLPPV